MQSFKLTKSPSVSRAISIIDDDRSEQPRAPPERIGHPATVYVRQDTIVDKIDRWISSLASAEVFAVDQLPDPATDQ